MFKFLTFYKENISNEVNNFLFSIISSIEYLTSVILNVTLSYRIRKISIIGWITDQ